MDRFLAATQVAAFFLIVLSSPLAFAACEDCESPLPEKPTGRVDVTAAVDAATAFVVKALRGLSPSYKVSIAEGEAVETPPTPTVAEYAAAYAARGGQPKVELPNFRHRSSWQLTYRDEAPPGVSQPMPVERVQGTDATLDDSSVFGLRFEYDYGWRR